VRAPRVDTHIEDFALRDQVVHKELEALEVDVVVAKAVHDRKVAVKLGAEVDGRGLLVRFGVVLRQAHVAFPVDGIVESLIRD
jgi:hypothetical protein